VSRDIPQRSIRACLAAFALAFAALSAVAAEDVGAAKRELSTLTRRLNDLSAWFSDAEKTQRDWQKQVKSLDEAIADASREIKSLEAELADVKEALDVLETERTRLEAERDEQARLIAQHLAAAYRLQGQDFFKMLLNQQNPDRFDRMIRYHEYFSAARAESLAAYKQTLVELAANADATRARQQTLRDRQQALDGERSELLAKRKDRERHLASLGAEMQDKAKQRTRLSNDRDRLQTLIVEITRRAQAGDGAFAANKGKMPWPVKGSVLHSFGAPRADGQLKWQGIFISAAEGTTVTAVHRGRVAFADWLRGFGLLTIVDHGNGFMSLYAHADVLYKQVGDSVESGEAIATAGKSGGQSETGLYFEIRAKGAPIDPLAWLGKR